MTNSPPFHTLLLKKSLSFPLPEVRKRYPLRPAKPPRTSHYRSEYPQFCVSTSSDYPLRFGIENVFPNLCLFWNILKNLDTSQMGNERYRTFKHGENYWLFQSPDFGTSQQYTSARKLLLIKISPKVLNVIFSLFPSLLNSLQNTLGKSCV